MLERKSGPKELSDVFQKNEVVEDAGLWERVREVEKSNVKQVGGDGGRFEGGRRLVREGWTILIKNSVLVAKNCARRHCQEKSA